MIPISTFNLTVSDRFIPNDATTTCTAVPATDVYGTDKKTYINIGSGNVFRLSWEAPTLTNDTVDYYKLVIKRHDTTLNVYYDIFDKNIGLVNEFYVDATLLPALPLQYMLAIYIVAYGKQGSVITSNIVNPYISKGTGTYVKVQPEGYTQPIMKRSIAFVNVPTLDEQISAAILDQEGNTVPLYDKSGNVVKPAATRILTSTDWSIMQESYTKGSDGTWHYSDIKYEVLVAKNGENKFEPIEVLNDEGTYELLHIL